MYEYINNELLLTSDISAYLLKIDDIISKKDRDNILNKHTKLNREQIKTILNNFDKAENSTYVDIKKIKTNGKNKTSKYYEILLSNGIKHEFDKDNYDFIKSFLGDPIDYQMSSNIASCFAKSDKGKCLVLGYKKKDQK